jgi:hypothetical protein
MGPEICVPAGVIALPQFVASPLPVALKIYIALTAPSHPVEGPKTSPDAHLAIGNPWFTREFGAAFIAYINSNLLTRGPVDLESQLVLARRDLKHL